MSIPTVAVAPEEFSFAQEHDIRNVHGAPSWLELVTSDLQGAKEVLEKLLGWEIVPLPVSDTGGAYLIANVAGHDVGGIREPAPGEPDGPRWVSYVTVADVDALAAEASAAGAEIAIPPMDLGTVGRMTVLASTATGPVYAFQYSERFA